MKSNYKIIANLFLIVAFLIFIFSSVIHISNIWLFIIVHRGSQAALIGAIADWFAVTAIFRYPLNIHFPHTNIIKNNKERIISSISNTVNDTWLGKNFLENEINRIDFYEIISKNFKKDRNKYRVMSYFRKFAITMFGFIVTDKFEKWLHEIINNTLDKSLSNKNIHEKILNNIALFMESDNFNKAYGLLTKQINDNIKTYNINNISKKVIELYSDELIESVRLSGEGLINANFDEIIASLSDYINLNIEENQYLLKIQIKEIIDNYKNNSIIKKILINFAEKTNVLDIEGLAEEIISKMQALIKDIKNNPLNDIRIKIKNYAFDFINNIKSNDAARNNILEILETALGKNLDKLKDYLLNYLNKEESKEIIKDKILTFIEAKGLDILEQSRDILKDIFFNAILKFLIIILEDNKRYIFNKKLFREKFNYALNSVQSESEKKHNEINKFLKENIIYLMKINHNSIGKLVRTNLENLDHDSLVNQIESKIGNDLQYIRINGALVGSLVGIIIAIISLFLKRV
ncbi:MAG: DUF445 family protein [bacterium]